MRRPAFILLIIAAALLVFVLILPYLVNANQFRPAIESELTKSLGRDVKIGDLKFGVFSGTVTAADLSVADDPAFSQTPFLRTKALTLSIDLLPALFAHQLNVRKINIAAPEISLIQAPSGQWNFSSMGTKPPPSTQQKAASSAGGNLALSVKSLKINDGRVSLTEGGGKPEVLDHVAVQVNDFAPGSSFPFSLSAKVAGGGDVALNGKAGPIDTADAANTPVSATLKMADLNLAASGAVPADSGIDGAVSLDGSVNSNGRTFEMTGKLKAEKLKLAPGAIAARNPLFFDVALSQDLKQHSGQMSRGDVSFGGVKASLTGTWTQVGNSVMLKMTFSAPGVPVSAVVDLLPALDIVLPAGSTLEGGTATAMLTISGPLSGVVISGPVSLRNTRLKGFDSGAKMAQIEKFAGLKTSPNTEIQTLSANLRIAPDGTTLQNIDLVLPAVGQLTGGGTISRTHALDFAMRAAVKSGVLVSGNPLSIPFFIGGTSSDPQFRPDLGGLASQEIEQRLKGVKVQGFDAGKTADSVLQGLFGGKKKKK